jgi:LysR family hydrogen peroxide-inducible transcriptional activator
MDAVELGSISAAAKKNLVSHPAVSQAITKMENDLGFELLVHQRKTFEVTPAGYVLAQKAKELLATLDGFDEKHHLQNDEVVGTVTLGVSRSLSEIYLNPLVTQLSKKHPKIKLQISFGTSNRMIEDVVQGKLELALGIGQHSMPTLKQTLLKQGDFVLIQGSKKKDSSEGFILTEPRYETELLKKDYKQKFKMPLPLLHEVASWDVITQLVAEGVGVGLVPDISITAERRTQIKKVLTPWFKSSYEVYLSETKNPRNIVVRSVVAEAWRGIVKN